MHAHKDRIYRIAFAILLDKHSAEDIVQEVLITVWQKRNGLDKLRSVEAWYTTVTKNKCINVLKKSSRLTGIRNLEKQESLTPVDYVQAKELKTNIEIIMSQLTPTQRTILHLKENEFLEYKEISNRLGLSISNIKIQVYRSRQFIANELRKIYKNESGI